MSYSKRLDCVFKVAQLKKNEYICFKKIFGRRKQRRVVIVSSHGKFQWCLLRDLEYNVIIPVSDFDFELSEENINELNEYHRTHNRPEYALKIFELIERMKRTN